MSGCSWLKPKEIRVPYPVEKEIPTVSHPKKVQLNKIRFYVVTDKNMLAFKNKLIHKNGKLVFVAISIKDYENLAKNVAELQRYISQQKDIINYYEESVKPKKDSK